MNENGILSPFSDLRRFINTSLSAGGNKTIFHNKKIKAKALENRLEPTINTEV